MCRAAPPGHSHVLIHQSSPSTPCLRSVFDVGFGTRAAEIQEARRRPTPQIDLLSLEFGPGCGGVSHNPSLPHCLATALLCADDPQRSQEFCITRYGKPQTPASGAGDNCHAGALQRLKNHGRSPERLTRCQTRAVSGFDYIMTLHITLHCRARL